LAYEIAQGPRVNAYCPYDAVQLRRPTYDDRKLICPCCWSYFDPLATGLEQVMDYRFDQVSIRTTNP